MKKCVLVVVVLSAMVGVAEGSGVIDTDLCKLVANPKEFNNKQVRVRAQLLKGIHGSALFDGHCKRAVSLWIAEDARSHSDFRALDDILIHHGNLGTADKTVIGTFTGQFLRNQRVPGTHKKTMVLEASKVEGLDVREGDSEGDR